MAASPTGSEGVFLSAFTERNLADLVEFYNIAFANNEGARNRFTHRLLRFTAGFARITVISLQSASRREFSSVEAVDTFFDSLLPALKCTGNVAAALSLMDPVDRFRGSPKFHKLLGALLTMAFFRMPVDPHSEVHWPSDLMGDLRRAAFKVKFYVLCSAVGAQLRPLPQSNAHLHEVCFPEFMLQGRGHADHELMDGLVGASVSLADSSVWEDKGEKYEQLFIDAVTARLVNPLVGCKVKDVFPFLSGCSCADAIVPSRRADTTDRFDNCPKITATATRLQHTPADLYRLLATHDGHLPIKPAAKSCSADVYIKVKLFINIKMTCN